MWTYLTQREGWTMRDMDPTPRGPDEGSGCSGCGSAGASSAAEAQMQAQMQQARLDDRLSHIKRQILVMSGKGGVGKSTVSASLAWSLARKGHQVGLLDADLHGPSIPLMTGVVGARPVAMPNGIGPVPADENLWVMSMGFLTRSADEPLIWRGPLRSSALRQLVADVEWGDLDYLITDLPPGTGDEALTVAQAMRGADGVIIVSTPQEASLADCRKAINFAHALDLPVVGVVENMSGFVCPHCGEATPIFSTGGARRMAEEMGVRYLGAIPLAPEVVTLSDRGKPVVGEDAPEAARNAFAALAEAVIQAVTTPS
jgi:ATP-binding protein involved in chromosome partitioning